MSTSLSAPVHNLRADLAARPSVQLQPWLQIGVLVALVATLPPVYLCGVVFGAYGASLGYKAMSTLAAYAPQPVQAAVSTGEELAVSLATQSSLLDVCAPPILQIVVLGCLGIMGVTATADGFVADGHDLCYWLGSGINELQERARRQKKAIVVLVSLWVLRLFGSDVKLTARPMRTTSNGTTPAQDGDANAPCPVLPPPPPISPRPASVLPREDLLRLSLAFSFLAFASHWASAAPIAVASSSGPAATPLIIAGHAEDDHHHAAGPPNAGDRSRSSTFDSPKDEVEEEEIMPEAVTGGGAERKDTVEKEEVEKSEQEEGGHEAGKVEEADTGEGEVGTEEKSNEGGEVEEEMEEMGETGEIEEVEGEDQEEEVAQGEEVDEANRVVPRFSQIDDSPVTAQGNFEKDVGFK
ncbi:hypothetical protein NBRC10513v2_001622 [Rhodotorula toruloides]